MSIHSQIMVIIPSLILVAFVIFANLKKRKRSAKSIYKLISDLEKKYIY